MPDWQPVQPKPDLPDTDCLVVHGWPAADCCDDVIMGRCCCTLQNGVCACRLSFWQWPCMTATRKSDVPHAILDVCLCLRSKIWTNWALFVDVNTVI